MRISTRRLVAQIGSLKTISSQHDMIVSGMSSLLNVLGTLAVLFGAPNLGYASALAWPATVLELKAEPRQASIVGVFQFQNTGTANLSIKEITPSCDCLTAEVSKRAVAPGESGQLKATLKIGDTVGLIERSITVSTDEPTAAPAVLTLHVYVPPLIDIKPRLLTWHVGDDAAEKPISIVLATNPALTLTETKSNSPDMSARIETVTPQREYRVWVKPASTAHRTRATIFIFATKPGSSQPEAMNIYAVIQ